MIIVIWEGKHTFLLLIRFLNAAEYNVPLLNIDTIDRAALMVCRQHAPAAKWSADNMHLQPLT